MKRIVCLGGGPAGLYAAILLRKALPSTRIEVYERNRADDTFGWGVGSFGSDHGKLSGRRPGRRTSILSSFHHWDDIAIHIGGRRFRSGGHGFCGIGRKRLLGLLQQRARDLGVHQVFQRQVDDDSEFRDADLIIAGDGVNSQTRLRHAEVFRPAVDVRKCRFHVARHDAEIRCIHVLRSRKTEHGWFQIHAYQFSRDLSTVIVENSGKKTWAAHGLDTCTVERSIDFCERLFERYLGGHKLQEQCPAFAAVRHGSISIHVTCERWHHGNIVLIGDS